MGSNYSSITIELDPKTQKQKITKLPKDNYYSSHLAKETYKKFNDKEAKIISKLILKEIKKASQKGHSDIDIEMNKYCPDIKSRQEQTALIINILESNGYKIETIMKPYLESTGEFYSHHKISWT